MSQSDHLPTLETGQQSPSENPQAETFSSDAPDLTVPDFDQPDGLAGDQPGEGGSIDPEFIGPDVFFEMHFKGCFAVSNMGYSMATKSDPLQSLMTAPDQEGARECSDALYEIILEAEALHFLIKPQSVWFKRIIAIGGFGYVVAMSVNAEIQFRREDAATRPDVEPVQPVDDTPEHSEAAA